MVSNELHISDGASEMGGVISVGVGDSCDKHKNTKGQKRKLCHLSIKKYYKGIGTRKSEFPSSIGKTKCIAELLFQ